MIMMRRFATAVALAVGLFAGGVSSAQEEKPAEPPKPEEPRSASPSPSASGSGGEAPAPRPTNPPSAPEKVESKKVAPAPPPRPVYRHNLPLDLTIIGVSGTAWIITEALKSNLASKQCFWCNPPEVDLTVKNALRWQDRQAADLLSYITGFGMVPLGAFGMDLIYVLAGGGTWSEYGGDVIVMAESITFAAILNQTVKFSVSRERPFVHDLSADQKLSTPSPADNDLSFFSGHTTLAFVSAVSAGSVASFKGYKGAGWIWATGLTLAAATGYLRIAADKHYFIDVLTGAMTGAAIGFWIPWLHQPSNPLQTKSARITNAIATPIGGGGAMFGIGGVLQ